MMEKSDRKMGKVVIAFAGVCLIALPIIVWSAFSFESGEHVTTLIPSSGRTFDQGGDAIFESYDRISRDYLEGTSTDRTLDAYYALRQYPGSPPFIPHVVREQDGAGPDCLACHARGGWTEELQKQTPITPHPEQASCRQCHVRMADTKLFVEHDWSSIAPPRLGRSHLPGGPPPIPHDLQMRGNCIACHVGPGAVTAIRVEHPSRGNCRQCHVPDSYTGLFQRKTDGS